jgi:hypothetical protein
METRMPEITVDQMTYDKLRFSATLMNRTTGEVVRLLVERLDSNTQAPPAATGPHPSSPQEPTPEAPSKWLPVFRKYKGRRFEGEFNPSTMELKITSEPWSGDTFASPTAAAQAVVAHVPGPRETNNTNGRKFWRLESGGGDLRTIVGQRL